MTDPKTKKKPGRKPADQESIYRQAERFETILKELDEKREAVVASIPPTVRDLMAMAGKLQKRQPDAPVEPEAPKPAAPQAKHSNGKLSNGAAAHS